MSKPIAAPAHWPYREHRTLAQVPEIPLHWNEIKWNSEMLDSLRKFRSEGMTYQECAYYLGVSLGVVSRKCKQMNWNRRVRHHENPGARGWL